LKSVEKPFMRVCISGSRDYQHMENVERILAALPKTAVIIHGGAHGVDKHADAVARRLGLAIEVHKPNWTKYGKAAGPIRNRTMVESAEIVYAFWDGQSKGTKSAIDAARQMGKELKVIADN
jgi:hypothetical protein